MTGATAPDHEYLLGTDDAELRRLAFQARVFQPMADALLDAGGVGPGAQVIDAGSGPGFVALEIARRVGACGRVLAIDSSARFLEHARRLDAEHTGPGRAPIDVLHARLDEVELPEQGFDAVFSRWVFSFLPDPEVVLARLLHALKPGGRVLIQDYHHEGIAVWPDSDGFRAVVRATRAFYRSAGGDAFVAPRLPRILRRLGCADVQVRSWSRCGFPDSDWFRWADQFFPVFSGIYVERGLMTAAERELFLAEWEQRRADPDAVFFTPTIVDVTARKS